MGRARQANGKKVADFARTGSGRIEILFEPIEASSIVVHIRGNGLQFKNSEFIKATPWLSEIEVY